MSENILYSDFIVELCKTCLTNKKILGLCQSELKYQYLSHAAEKKVFKYLFETYDITKTIPTVGVIGQQFVEDKEVINFLSKVKNAQKIDNDKIVIDRLVDHIKKIKFKNLIERGVELYNNPATRDESYLYVQKESEEINNYAIQEKFYKELFSTFNERNAERLAKNNQESGKTDKISFGIHQLDSDTSGGMKRQTSALFMARSGGGKSTFLRWVGLHNARLGMRVVHFQLEGSEQDAFDNYDAAWTGTLTEDMAIGVIDVRKIKQVEKARADIMNRGGQLFVYASESFDSLYIEDAREILLDIRSIYGEIDLIVFDYLEIANIRGNFSGEAGERRRREKLANQLTNMAVEFDAALITAIQSNDVPTEKRNDPNFKLTRSNISEFKGAVKPFSYFITGNATDDQLNKGIAFLYADKYRHHRAGGITPIYQDLSRGKYYDAEKTLKEFIDER